MFFEEEDRLHPDLLHVVRRELYAISSNNDVSPFGLKYVPTHTEDGIPIRKLYVSNLPPKTTRSELFGVFAQYGFIKSCWLRMGDRGQTEPSSATYAFVTFSNPADAHKALQAPSHEKALRGRYLKISPADSWHQPDEDDEGRPKRRSRGRHHSTNELVAAVQSVSRPADVSSSSSSTLEMPQPEPVTKDPEEESSLTILNMLNPDCLAHIMSYVPIRDLIRSERVSKSWQSMVQEYIEGLRTFKTSWWQNVPVVLTTAVLRRVLQRIGLYLTRLHIDHHWSSLNDRTAHVVGKFCPNLEELKIVGMHTKNWNPLTYGCKQLKILSFVSCSKVSDANLVNLVKTETCVENLTVANNTHVTGLFLTGTNPQNLTSLAFYNCYSLEGAVLSAAIEGLTALTTLKLDVCSHAMWKTIPSILNKLPKLEELSLSEYMTPEVYFSLDCNDAFCEAISNLTELKTLNLSRNSYISNAIMKRVAQCCTKLESLNVSSCNSRPGFPQSGVGDEGVAAVCRSCLSLAVLDVSYLADLTDAGLAGAGRLTRLRSLSARGNLALTVAPLAACMSACPQLQELDLCGCDGVSEEIVCAAMRALEHKPRPLILRLAGTSAAASETCQPESPAHKLLSLNFYDDPHLRPDFVDRIFDDSSDDGDEDNDDFDDFLNLEDEIYIDDEDLADFEGFYQFGIHAHDILML